LIPIFGFDVTADSTALEKDEPIIVLGGESKDTGSTFGKIKRVTYDVRNLTERMLLEIFWTLVFSFHHVNLDDLVWDFFLFENGGHPATARGFERAIEFQDHCRSERV
jgi:hypothetical protein